MIKDKEIQKNNQNEYWEIFKIVIAVIYVLTFGLFSALGAIIQIFKQHFYL